MAKISLGPGKAYSLSPFKSNNETKNTNNETKNIIWWFYSVHGKNKAKNKKVSWDRGLT